MLSSPSSDFVANTYFVDYPTEFFSSKYWIDQATPTTNEKGPTTGQALESRLLSLKTIGM